MKNKRGIKRRVQQLRHDLYGVAKSHGGWVLALYVGIKIIGKIPFASSALRRVCRGRLLVRMRILGSWMYLNLLDPGISYQLLVHGIREPGHVEQIKGALKSGMRGIEAGANIGYYTLLESHLVGPEGYIFCIEPAPANIALLRRNIRENHFDDRTTCFQYLVGEKNGQGKLFLSPAANSHSIAAISDHFVELPMVTLDHFVASENIDPAEIDFIRMDIEGYEVMVLQHMGALLTRKNRPLKLFIELHPAAYEQWGWTLEKLLEYLTTNLGFAIRSVVQESIKDESGHLTDKIVSMANAEELSRKYREWERTGPQNGILAFFELPARPE